jgi:phosphate transport system ATP-binding protein
MAPFKGIVAHPLETAYHPRESRHGEAVDIKDFSLWYGDKQALYNINMTIQRGLVTAIIGPSGCGKSTLLRSLNRINDLIDELHVKGRILFGGNNIYERDVDVITLRRRMGMVFQKPNPFPKTIEENVNYPLRIGGVRDKQPLRETAETALKGAALWDVDLRAYMIKDPLNIDACTDLLFMNQEH